MRPRKEEQQHHRHGSSATCSHPPCLPPAPTNPASRSSPFLPLLLLLLLLLSAFLIFSPLPWLPLLDRVFSVPFSVSDHDLAALNHSFTDLLSAYRLWDHHVGCRTFSERERNHEAILSPNPSLQNRHSVSCPSMKLQHVVIFVKQWRWLPNNLDNLYSCDCGLTCVWTKSKVLADNPDAELFETANPPRKRKQGEPLRVYMDLEPERKSPGYEDIFVGYHANDTVQVTYAGASFHVDRSFFVSSIKRKDVLVYWSSSNCVPARSLLARGLLKYLPHHSFGRCLNNVGGRNELLKMYPSCKGPPGIETYWAYHLHCAMSHYKFVLAIENTITESYVTEKLFYALDAGAIPIYFGAPNVKDFVPPHSIIDGSTFDSLESLAEYVKKVGTDPILYAEYHAWRRCGLMGPYHQTRAISLDSLPCRLCGIISKLGGKDHQSS